MPSPGVSLKQKQSLALVEPCIPPFPASHLISVLSSHPDLLSKTTVILCTSEDLSLFLTTPPPQHDPGNGWHCTACRSLNLSIADDGDDGDGDVPDTASSHSSLASLQPTSNKIPKPDGEPGRPGRGGYNLKSQLALDSATFLRLKKFLHRSIKKHLDATKCKSRQNSKAIRLVIQEALDAFPELEDYDACWPVEDFIQMRLKYTSRRSRLSQRVGQ